MFVSKMKEKKKKDSQYNIYHLYLNILKLFSLSTVDSVASLQINLNFFNWKICQQNIGSSRCLTLSRNRKAYSVK